MPEPAPTFHKLDDFEPIAAQSKHVLAHWKSLRGDERVPLWKAFDPLDISETLSKCAILEFTDIDHFTVRLFGNDLVERFGNDITGSNFLDTYEPDQKPGAMARAKIIRTRPAILCTIVTSLSPMGVPIVAESMLFPFCESDGAINRGLLSIHELGPDDTNFPKPSNIAKGTNLLKFDVLDL